MNSMKSSLKKPLDSLPKVFIDSMKILFDILDEKGVGLVHYKDIERRWCEDEVDLPNGVLECLLKVTPPNGLLSFERFVAGLRICLLRTRAESRLVASSPAGQVHVPSDTLPASIVTSSGPHLVPLPPAARCGDDQLNTEALPASQSQPPAGAIITPSSTLPPLSACTSSVFVPDAAPGQTGESTAACDGVLPAAASQNGRGVTGASLPPPQLISEQDQLQAPPKPPRQLLLPAQPSRQQILCALQRWHRERVNPASCGSSASLGVCGVDTPPLPDPGHQGDADDVCDFPASVALVSAAGRRAAAARNRRLDSRRHTLQHGIDHGLLRRVRHIEAEMALMRRGLAALDQARDWYCQRLAALRERMQSAGVMGRVGCSSLNTERSSDAAEERLGLLTARVQEVNQLLLSLVEPARRGSLPLHINLAIQPSLPAGVPPRGEHDNGAGPGAATSGIGGAGQGAATSGIGGSDCMAAVSGVNSRESTGSPDDRTLQRTIHQLKLQNQRLTQEVADKTGRITSLESDKTNLIRQLFNARSELTVNSGCSQHSLRTMDESTLM